MLVARPLAWTWVSIVEKDINAVACRLATYLPRLANQPEPMYLLVWGELKDCSVQTSVELTTNSLVQHGLALVTFCYEGPELSNVNC